MLEFHLPRLHPRRAALLTGLLLVLLASLLPARSQAASTWAYTNLASCCSIDGQSGTFTGAYLAVGLNDRGDVVGNALSGGIQQGYVWRNNTFRILTHLAPLPGGSYTSPVRNRFASAVDINEAGTVVGTASDGLPSRHPSGGQHAVTWKPFTDSGTTPFDLGAYQYTTGSHVDDSPCGWSMTTPLDCYTQGTAINDAGDLAGTGEYNVAQTVDEGSQYGWPLLPFRIPGGDRKLLTAKGDPGAPDMLFYDVLGGHKLHAFQTRGMNASGQVVVTPNPSTPNDENTSGIYTRQSGGFGTPIPFKAGDSIFSKAINDQGWVVGADRTTTRAKLFKGGQIVNLPPLPGDIYSSANAINDRGDVVGASASSSCRRAVLWRHTDYTTPIDIAAQTANPSTPFSDAWDINERGQIVGSASTQPCGAGQSRPFLVTPPALLKIDDVALDQPDSGTGTIEFTVSLDSPSTDPITVDFATVNGTGNAGAKSGVDYTATSGTLTFAPGTTSKKIPVTVLSAGTGPNKTFTVKLTNAVGTSIDDDTGVGTIRNKSPLQVTLTPEQTRVEVEQNRDGPIPVDVKVEIAVTNTGNVPVDHVQIPEKLTLGWDGPAPAAGFPITQVDLPESARDLGTAAPGQTLRATYTLTVRADGKFTVDALVLADGAGQTLRGFATGKLESDTRLLVVNAEMGAQVRSQNRPGMIRAGSPFLVNVTLENRSFHRKIVVDPLYGELGGNAADGHAQERDVVPTAADPKGAMDEVRPSPYVVLAPGEKREFVVVVRTSASDAFAKLEGGGGTRATVGIAAPRIRAVSETNEVTDLPADRALVTDGSGSFAVSIDDAAPETAPFNPLEATFYVSAGSIWGLWRFTWGTFRGIVWDLPVGVVSGVWNVSSATLNAIDRTVELWYAIKDDPELRSQFFAAVGERVATAFKEAPFLLAGGIASIPGAVNHAIQSKLDALAKEWYAGDWKGALFELSASGNEGLANIATIVGPGLLARFPAAAAKWQAAKSALYTKLGNTLQSTVKKAASAKVAMNALRGVIQPGFVFTEKHMTRIFGISAKENGKIALYAKAKKISITLRSRAKQSIKFLEEGKAVLKPYWVKTKNVNQLDVDWLGYHADDIGSVVCRRPISEKTLLDRLRKRGVKPGTPQWEDIRERWKTRKKEWDGEFREMTQWDEAKGVKGKWPWEDNGVDPKLQADESRRYGFKLVYDKKKNQYVPQIRDRGKWKFITGDIDLIAITKADGTALEAADHVSILKDLRVLMGAQHPESATWINKAGDFWFTAKRNYLLNDGECCLAQYGIDGLVRAVKFNEALSAPWRWKNLNYRIRWFGAYQEAPGT